MDRDVQGDRIEELSECSDRTTAKRRGPGNEGRASSLPSSFRPIGHLLQPGPDRNSDGAGAVSESGAVSGDPRTFDAAAVDKFIAAFLGLPIRGSINLIDAGSNSPERPTDCAG